ncbi:hypothetical protein [Endozoicomonas sp. ISHI1]|uniref:hypothetical protein n=1 Tax=Endozoicomonas sp. ISHI1 TaxID=2825882 RepID=UPI0021482BF3|nr:hypothetical protein [Endozoicomonas sp. ISHI1]
MIKRQHYLTRLMAPILLLQALNIRAQATTQSPTTNPFPTVSCQSLTKQTPGVEQQLKQYSHLVRNRQCVVLTPNPDDDLDQKIKQIPENTVILFSSGTVQAVTPSPSASPVTEKIQVKYFIRREIVLKDGQDLLGAADDGFEIVIMLHPTYNKKYMVRAGATDNFHFRKTKDSHIRHITFLPTGTGNRRPVDTILFAECFNRRLILENNEFNLPNQAAVDLDCKEPLDASAHPMRPGPGLRFINNTAIGTTINTPTSEYIPDEVININLPAIRNQSKRIAVIGNTFRGKMAKAGEFMLGPGTSMDIFRNTVYIASSTLLGAIAQQGGFVFIGHKDINAELSRYNLAGNEIWVKGTAITVFTPLKLALACNHLQAVIPWQQFKQEFSLKAIHPWPQAAVECTKLMGSSVVMPNLNPTVLTATPTLYTTGQVANIWSAINGSTATACSGLVNLEGLLFFDSEVCSSLIAEYAQVDKTDSSFIMNSSTISTSSTTKVPTSSAGKAIKITGLGVIITLTLLLLL